MVMPPNQQPQRPNLDFIMNPGPPPKKSLLPAGNSTMQRAIFAGVILVLLIIGLVVVSNLLSADTKELKATFTKAAQQQTELVRVAQLGNSSVSQTAKNLGLNTSLTIASDQKLLVSTLAAHKVKISDKSLGKLANTETDKSLETAKAASNFDATFIGILDEQLKAYQTTLNDAYSHSKNKAVQETLRTEYAHAGLLVKQAEAQP
jgi:flagellar basal body-associated protein FliL